jgi:glycosyltransferase involved in cell wall biosynthesis
MAVYNGARYLRPAIDSILDQTFANFDFIIVNDGSTDQTAEILHSYYDKRIRIISQENQGPGAAANHAIIMSSAEYIARLDSDDLAAPERLAKQVEFMDQNPDFVIVGGFMEIITEDNHSIYVQQLPTSSNEIKQSIRAGGCPFVHSSVMFRRQSAFECGLYNEDLRYYHDPDLYRRLVATGQMANLPVCLGKYRIAPGAITNQPRRALNKRDEILHKAERGDMTEEERHFLKNVILHKNIAIDKSIYALRVGKTYLMHTDDVRYARPYLWQSVKSWTFNWPAWYNLVLAYLPLRVRLALNRLRGTAS